MKKLIIIFILFFSFFGSFGVGYGSSVDDYKHCKYTDYGELTKNILKQNKLEGKGRPISNNMSLKVNLAICKPKKTVNIKNTYFVETGLKELIKTWVTNISILLSILAVGAIVYGAFLMVTSVGDDEKVKKAKDVIKWAMLGFLGVISAGALITVVINIMYWI